ncbi:MAG: NAD-dependent epimerase/dehydratase family protein [Candidatus Kariarchaeaceae archaeon]|jgi:nucleoside-diphosphate-sugar epimerase
MKAVVFGATGLVGYHTLAELIHGSFADSFSKVLATGRNKQKLAECRKLGSAVKVLDLSDQYESFAFLDEWGGKDVVWFNCAAALSGANHTLLDAVNVKGVKKLLQKAKELEISRFVHVSSITIYGLGGSQFTEDRKQKPESSYGKSKLRSEQIVISSHINWTIFRPSFIGGPYDQNFLYEFGRRIKQKKIPFISRDGRMGFVDARDLAHYMVKASLDTKTNHQAYNIQGETTSYRDFINTFGGILKASEPYGREYPYRVALLIGFFAEVYAKIRRKNSERGISRYRIRSLTSERTMDTSKIIHELDFKPKYTLSQSIADWVESLDNAN